MRGRIAMAMFAVSVMLAPSRAGGSGLIPNFELSSRPEIASFFVSVSYDADADVLACDGYAFEVTALDGATHAILGGAFFVDATVDESGSGQDGALAITGSVPSAGAPGPDLLLGRLTGFGYGGATPGVGPFQYAFEITGGDLAEMFGGPGTPIGVNLTQDLGFAGSWAEDFAGNGTSIATTAVLAQASSGPDDGACACTGDLDCNGRVDVADLIDVILDWGACDDGAPCPSDLDHDGTVGVTDLLMLLGAWGLC